VQTFLIVREHQQFLFEAQVLLARFRRAAHAGEAMVFRRHRPIFGGTNHRLLPRNAIRAAGGSEQTPWDAQTGPVNEVLE
jgi:hypothetical protein